MSRRDPFANFDRVRREIDELFGDAFDRSMLAPRRGFSPRVDVYFAGDPPRTVVQAELAGIEIERVGIEIHGRRLVLAGERLPRQDGGRLYQQVEIEYGPFRRVVDLGGELDAEAARATYENGILQIEIPLVQAESRVRRVPVHDVRPQVEPPPPEGPRS